MLLGMLLWTTEFQRLHKNIGQSRVLPYFQTLASWTELDRAGQSREGENKHSVSPPPPHPNSSLAEHKNIGAAHMQEFHWS